MISNNNHIIYYQKDLDLFYVNCNETFLRYTGLPSTEKLIGMRDTDLCWHEYAAIYDQFEIDLISTKKLRTTLAPIKNYKKETLWLIGNKYIRQDSLGKTIGTETIIMEVLDPKIIELGNHLNKTNLTNTSLIKGYQISCKNDFLSSREEECLFYLLKGKSSKVIANLLKLSSRTVEHYIENLKFKFNCRTKSELIISALEKGYSNFIPRKIYLNKSIDKS